MARTKITSKVLALSAAQTNINNDGSFTLSVPTQINNTVSVSGNLTVDTNTLFVDSVNNRVGIGTNNPLQAIDFRPVTFDANQSGGIRFDNTAGQWPCGIYIRSDGVGGPRLSLDAPFQTNTLNLYSNNVGIGTTTPNEKLTVVGNISATGNLTVDTNTLFVDSTNNSVGIGTTTPTAGYALDVVGAAKIGGNILCGGSILYLNSQQSLTQETNSLTLGAATYFTTINYGNASTTIHNFAAGNVGIGTATPNEKLHIYDSVDAHLKIAGADTAGSIRKLSLERSTGGAEIHFNEDTRITQGLTLNTTNAAYPMSFQINGDTKMFVSTAGSVGIGTTTPSTPLHTYTAGNNSLTIEAGAGDSQVMLKSAGSLKFLFGYEDSDNGFRIYNYGTSATSLFAKSTNGYIGIGTVDPNERLTVSGNANISGNISANNLVYNTGNQTVSGIKNFQSVPLVSGEEVCYKKNVVYFTGDNFTPDANLARTFEYVLTGLAGASATLNAPINMNNGENIVIKIKQSPSGSNNIIFNSNYKFPGGVIPSLTFTPDKADIYTALKIDSNFYSTYIKDFIN